jgi:hypothetical protein
MTHPAIIVQRLAQQASAAVLEADWQEAEGNHVAASALQDQAAAYDRDARLAAIESGIEHLIPLWAES